MPSTSKKQADFMRAVAHNPDFAKKVDVPQSVGKDFEVADQAAGRFQGKQRAMAQKLRNRNATG